MYFRGAGGQVFRFSVHRWRDRLRRLPGVYLATTCEMSGGMEAHRILLAGETDDISSPFHRHPMGGCLKAHSHKRKCICLHTGRRWRVAVVRDLIAAHDPPCNRPD